MAQKEYHFDRGGRGTKICCLYHNRLPLFDLEVDMFFCFFLIRNLYILYGNKCQNY